MPLNLLASPRLNAPAQARGSPPSTDVLVMQSLCHVSGDSVTLSVNLKLLQAWRIQGTRNINNSHQYRKKKRFTESFSLDNVGDEERKSKE